MRYKITFSYCGKNFFGYAKQIKEKTIQGEIERVFAIIFQKEVTIYSSGRTDKGVHAVNQVAHFDIDNEIKDLKKFLISFNKLVDGDIYLKNIEKVDYSFHARFSAISKTYLYVINFSNYDVLMKDFEIFDKDINVEKIKSSSNLFVGKHCFKNFCSKEEDENAFIRTINDIKVENLNGRILIYLTGDGFMRYEVRKIVGTLIEFSKGKIDENFINSKLNSSSREIVSFQAPSKALYLYNIGYSVNK